jgi:multiple sugar transport system ATP-binding protein
MTQLALKSLSKSYGAFKVLENLNLEAEAGEIIVVFGGSGTGKTILLRLVAGSIELAGQDMTDIAPEHRNVGMAFQNFALFPHMSAAANIASPLEARKSGAATIKAGVDRVAKLLKIEHVLGHAPRELSNGQKQRTSLARALVAEPKILLLDDPLRNVDAKLRFEMRLELPRLLRQSGATVLYVTQDYKEAMALADRIAVLQGGGFVQLATPAEIYERPATLQVAKLFGDPVINTFETRVELKSKIPSVAVGGVDITLPADFARIVGQDVMFAVRPDAVVLNDKNSTGISATVLAVTPLNERTVILLQADNGWEFLASLPSSVTPPKPSATIKASFAASGIHVFDKTTGGRING